MNKKVKTKVTSILFMVLLLVSNSAYAKIYKCTTDGKLVYQSEPCPIIESDNDTQQFFGFDGWKFGTSIHSMKQKAKERQLAISPGTLVFIQSFNEKLLNQQPKARKYTYRTKIMEKLTTVTLFFTKTTEELYKIKVIFHVIQVKPEERKYFYEALYTQLSQKYGKPKNIDREDVKRINKGLTGLLTKGFSVSMLGSLQAWGVGTNNLVTLSYKKQYHLMSSYELHYKYIPLVIQNDKEITYDIKKRTNSSVFKDKNKL